jgi:hypothetical protein
MNKCEGCTFVGIFVVGIAAIVLIDMNNWDQDFIIFFFFSAFFTAQTINTVYKHRQSIFANKLENAKSKFTIISLALIAFSLLFSGIMHVAGGLNFPEFILMDGWNNGYIIATRAVWFATIFLDIFLYKAWNLEEKNIGTNRFPIIIKRRRRGKINFLVIFLRTLTFPTISIPLVVLAADFFGLVFVREFISQLSAR